MRSLIALCLCLLGCGINPDLTDSTLLVSVRCSAAGPEFVGIFSRPGDEQTTTGFKGTLNGHPITVRQARAKYSEFNIFTGKFHLRDDDLMVSTDTLVRGLDVEPELDLVVTDGVTTARARFANPCRGPQIWFERPAGQTGEKPVARPREVLTIVAAEGTSWSPWEATKYGSNVPFDVDGTEVQLVPSGHELSFNVPYLNARGPVDLTLKAEGKNRLVPTAECSGIAGCQIRSETPTVLKWTFAP